VIGYLDEKWPFQAEDRLAAAAHGLDVFKKKHGDDWQWLLEANAHPDAASETIVRTILKENARLYRMATYNYDRRTAAKPKHPEVVRAFVEFLKTGPFKPYLKVKSARGDRIVLTPVKLNAQVERVEISGLNGDKAEFVIFLESGESGWAWDVERKPPAFHNDAGYNVIHLDRLAKHAADDLTQQIETIVQRTLVPIIQKAGWVKDPLAKRVVPLATWKASETERADAAAKAKAEADERAEKARAEREQQDLDRAEREKTQPEEEVSTQAWSVVRLDDGYASEVQVYRSKPKAEREANDQGDSYVVKGTQMWNEPLGQVEEHDRDAPYRYFPYRNPSRVLRDRAFDRGRGSS
jgi:hypothetical protein